MIFVCVVYHDLKDRDGWFLKKNQQKRQKETTTQYKETEWGGLHIILTKLEQQYLCTDSWAPIFVLTTIKI